MIRTDARNTDLANLIAVLQDQHARRIDVTLPAGNIRMREGQLNIHGVTPVLDEDGVTTVDGAYTPTQVFDGHLSDKLNIPLPYVRWMRENRPDLYDTNVNGLLHGKRINRAGEITEVYPADARSFFFRLLRGDEGDAGVARAMLSNRYRRVDHLDVLFAALKGIREAGVETVITGADLTETRMSVKVVAPQVRALAPALLAGYRSPFAQSGFQRVPGGTGLEPTTDPVVAAGFKISNSETGGGAFSIQAYLTVLVCLNGMTVGKALRAVHLGTNLEDGLVRYSDETTAANEELVALQTRDAVRTFLDADYVTARVRELESKAGKPIEDPAKAIEVASKKLAFTKDEQTEILRHFIAGGQLTAGGVMQAVTSYAQTIASPDRAYDLENAAAGVLELV